MFTDCLKVTGDGFVHVITKANSIIKLKAIHVPDLINTLISLGRLYKHGCEIHCTGTSSFDIVNNRIVFFKASIVGGTCMVRINTTYQGIKANIWIEVSKVSMQHLLSIKISLTCVSLSSSGCIPSSRQSRLPTAYWGEAVNTAVFLENITPTQTLSWKSPHKAWFGRAFDYTCLCPFGCKAFVNILKKLCEGKFSDTAKPGILLGYQPGMHNWRILLQGGKVEHCHDVVFDEADLRGDSLFFPADNLSELDTAVQMDFQEDEDLMSLPQLANNVSSGQPESSRHSQPENQTRMGNQTGSGQGAEQHFVCY
ncbi:uncharacterized protein VP01_486g1 [Puccinia sorghi]|uniref:Retroviral polymerase SH3-like domain-containing protein n=1 Tax=Puccinia sorghi TaxID=27349 RepID=A0A0L6UP83_9BASI|nr:uncharacterized protein VP01_486g1 [Puccinia sorghi]